MEIDIRTLSVVVALAYVLEASALAFLYVSSKKYPGIAWWVFGSTLMAIGYMGMLLRDLTQNTLVAILLPNILIASGSVVIYIGILRFFGKKENRGLVLLLLALFVAAFWYFTYVNGDISVRTAIISVFLALVFFLMALALWSEKSRAITRAAQFLAAVLCTLGFFLVLRTVIILTLVPVDGVFTPTLIQTATALVFFIFGILLTLGLIILVNQRLNEEITEAKEDFELIFHHSPEGVLFTRLDDGTTVDTNEGLLHLTGFSRNEAIGSPIFENQLWNNSGDRQHVLDELKKNGFCEGFETVLLRKDASGVYCVLSARIVNLRNIPHVIYLIRDITDRKQAEDALRKSEAKFRTLFESADDAIFIMSSTTFLDCNQATLRIYGCTRDQIIGHSPVDFSPERQPDGGLSSEKAQEKIALALAGQPQSFEWVHHHADGTPFDAEVTLNRVSFKDGDFLQAIVRDISERKREEDYTRILGKIADEAPVSVTVHDFEGNFLYANEETFRLHGFPREEFMKKNLHEIDVPESEHLIAKRMEQIRERGEADFEVQHYRKDGSVFPLHINARVVDWGGRWVLLSIATDLSERQRADRLLKESEEKFRKVFENSPMGMVLVSQDFRFISVNPAWIAMTGYSEKELLKLSFKDITHPDYLAGDMEHIRELVAGKIPVYQTEKRYIRKDGSILWGFIRVTIIRDPQGMFRNFAAQIEDITERKRAEALLAAAQQQYRELFENVSIGILRSTPGPEGALIEANPAALRIFEADSREQFFAVRPVDLYADFDQRRRISEEILSKGIIRNMEVQYKTLKGNLIWGKISSIKKISADGQTFFDNTIEDITAQKRTDEALKKTYALLTETQEISQLGGWEFDVITGKIRWTEEVYRIHGVGRDFDPGQVSRDIQFYTQKDIPVISEAFRRCCEQGEPYDLEVELIRADGRQIWVRTMGKPDVQDGRVVRVHGNIIDITERRKAEEALRERTSELEDQNRLISTLLDTVPMGIFMVEAPSGRPMIANAAATRLLGRGVLPDTTEKNLAEVYEAYRAGTADRYPTTQMPIVRGMQGESSHIDDMEVVRPDGTRTLLEIFGNPVFDSQDHIVASLVSFLDITDRKRAEEQREDLIHELGKKNAELDRFTYTVSHDLKSPLLSISAFLALLEGDIQTGNTERVALDIRRISESAEKLEGLITTLLTLSRSGRCVSTALPVPLKDLARDAAGLLDASLKERGVSLVIPENLPVVKGDRQRLLQVMTNLLDNAVKFMGDTTDPRIGISVRPGAGTPIICVQDNGMGIMPQNLEKAFGLYERFNPEIPGTGIGLATVKRIIEAHGGTIWVESEGEGKGTTVCFTLPVVGEGRTDNNNTA